MYRSRLGGDLGRITLEYVSSIDEDSEIVAYDIIGSQAHVLMLHKTGIITKNDAKRILSALERLKGKKLKGDSEDIHELVESLVIQKAGTASGGKMHTARSRNDQISLDMRMKIRDDIGILCGCILDAAESMVSLAERHQRTVMPLYTHLQQAQAGTFSHYLLAHADALLRDLGRLSDTYKRVNQSPLGAGPVGGTSLGIDRNYTAELLGFSGVVENSVDATSTRDFAAEYVSDVAILMTNLSRLAEDFVVWSSTEFSFVGLADEFASPSSVMPQKKNPDILELTRGKTARVIGNLTGILAAIKGLGTGYGRDLQEIKSPVWFSSQTAISALVVVRSMLLTVTINEKAMKKAAEGGYLVALDVAEKLVTGGIPFRTAHGIAGQLVQLAHGSQRPLDRLTPTEIGLAIKGTKADRKTVAGIIKSVTVSSSLRERISQGSAGFSEQKRMIGDRKTMINSYRTEMARWDGKISKALEGLSDMVKEMTK